ncbi:alpha-(1,3)-fucosyltransferase C-like isoform X2 [Argopecten irradians]|uniref:alpha-(1,3)-fucosyltransferase C-like isoform X2 n=1 Tax=Argopecten irradians TaxID=31199 RepID=UPI00371EFD65
MIRFRRRKILAVIAVLCGLCVIGFQWKIQYPDKRKSFSSRELPLEKRGNKQQLYNKSNNVFAYSEQGLEKRRNEQQFNNESNNVFEHSVQAEQKQENVQVHYYNKPPSVSLQAFSKCPDRCTMTHGKKDYKNKKIVIFHGPDLFGKPPKKYRGQLWIMQAMEPPYLYADHINLWKRVFNWTLVHRRDSDVFTPYGSFAPIRSQSDIDTRPINWANKTRIAAWFVSKCKTPGRREDFVRLLQHHTNVHIYGKCGNLSCPRSVHNNCLEQLKNHYLFYLSFENSLCADYLTEKVTRLMQDGLDVIPVVRGTGDLYKMHLPPNSFISAHDYTAQGLAEKMISISKNKEEFKKYFEWRQQYYAEEIDLFYCDLCRKLHSANKYERLYESITHWVKDHPHHTNCHEATDLKER